MVLLQVHRLLSLTTVGLMDQLFYCVSSFLPKKGHANKDQKVLLLLDNHEAHKYYPALEYASEHHIICVSFAPHTINKMQPLHIAIYGPIKKYFEQELNTFQKIIQV